MATRRPVSVPDNDVQRESAMSEETDITDDFPSSAPDKRQMTAKDLLESGLVGIWKDRTDIGDTLEFALTLRERTTARRRD